MTGDLLAGQPPTVTLADQIRCAERELSMRRHVYPRRVELGRMQQGTMAEELARMEAVVVTLKALAVLIDEDPEIAPLFDALGVMVRDGVPRDQMEAEAKRRGLFDGR